MSFIKKNGFSKVIVLAMVATMVFGSTITAYATEPETEEGSGNILAYTSETYVVPTSLKIALNPSQLAVNIRYKKTADTTVSASKTYYTYDSENDKYVYVAKPADASIATYYEADQSTDQVVSFNYGIANESTKDKKVGITLEVTGEATNNGDDYQDITFVDTAAEATAKSSASDETGAGFGELKMFLTIAPSTAAPTTNTYKKTADTTVDSSKKYYTWDDTNKKYVEAANLSAFADGTEYYEATTTIGTRILASELADVSMTAVAADKKVAFKAGEEASSASASIGYKLDKATYALKTGEIVDWSTTQSALANKLELSALGGTCAFTIDGVMNANADWTKAKATVLTITPTYDVKDADGTEEVMEDAGYNQIETEPAAPADTAPAITGATRVTDQDWDYTMTFTKGAAYTLSATNLTGVKWGNAVDDITKDSANITVSDGTVTIASGMWASIEAGGVKYLKLTIDGTDYIVKVTIA